MANTIMLGTLDEKGQSVNSINLTKQEAMNHTYYCKGCGGEMTFVNTNQEVRVPHFRHLKGRCPYDTTIDHDLMKDYAGLLFTKNNYKDIEFEKKLVDDNGDYRIADLFIKRPIRVWNREKTANIPKQFPAWVIECENKSDGYQIDLRTQDYNQMNFPVLWFLNSQKLKKIDKSKEWPAKMTNEGERFMNKVNDGTVYYLSPELPEIDEVHFSWTSRKWEKKRCLVIGQVQLAGKADKVYAMRRPCGNQKYDIVKLPGQWGWYNNAR